MAVLAVVRIAASSGAPTSISWNMQELATEPPPKSVGSEVCESTTAISQRQEADCTLARQSARSRTPQEVDALQVVEPASIFRAAPLQKAVLRKSVTSLKDFMAALVGPRSRVTSF
mmetsp:Transcript_2732/g.10714  ORF Transcript_2732/g.10714 Transcript_2732/m.10714 type:complete len:116 (-) Transcript_2732:957-1304(-)